MMNSSERVDAVVIGSGAAGLACAHHLVAQGHVVRLVERGSQPGGVIRTVRKQGYLLEQGPFNVLVRSPEFVDLLQELRIPIVTAKPTAAGRRYVLTCDGLEAIPSSLVALLKTPLLSIRGKCRVLAGLLCSRRGMPNDTMENLFRRRMGKQFAERIGSAATVGIWAGESHHLEAAACLPGIAVLDQATRFPLLGFRRLPKRPAEAPRGLVSFHRGLSELAQAIATRLGSQLQLDTEISRVDRTASGWTVQTRQGESITAEHLVLACGAKTAASLLLDSIPGISQELAGIQHTSLVTVNLGFHRRDVSHSLDGYGFLVPRTCTRGALLGALFASTAFPHHAPVDQVLLRVFLGGTRAPEVADLPEDELTQLAVASIQAPLGVRSHPIMMDVARWKETIPVYGPGHSQRVERINNLARRQGLWLAGNFLQGLSVNDCLTQGIRVARSIHQQLGENPCPRNFRELCPV